MPRKTVHGEEVIILKEDKWGGYESIPVANLTKKVEDIYSEETLVKMEADMPPGFRNMPLIALIKSNSRGNNSMGWKQHQKALKDEGFDA